MDITSRHALETAFLNTYAREGERHPLREFEQYDLIMTHRDNDPNTGARNLSRRLDLSESKINGWLSGSQPTGFDGYEKLDNLGWFELEWDGDQFRAINELLAWIYSSGTILDRYRSRLTIDSDVMRADAEQLCERAGLEPVLSRSGHDDKSSELRLTEPGAAAARFFVAMGTPMGGKATQRYGLPHYLSIAPENVRREFAARYIVNRGVARPNYAGPARSVAEQRPQAYLNQLYGLFRSLTDEEIRRGGEIEIHLSGAAVKSICAPVESVAIDANSQN